ncbi:outer membrane protein assembly factor BamC [Arhodomonas sp. SL1]|uniref:outer membrane protein assembly factor BamC n=1 Tax=Arhodomonas sp. SL1 TaxID=3425691 RepID=UPI003F8859A0
MKRPFTYLAMAALAGMLSGCSWFSGDTDSSPRIEQLKLPPDLTRDRTEGLMAIPGSVSARGGDPLTGEPVLPQPGSVSVRRAGDDRWLEVDASPQEVWGWIDDFVDRQGVRLERRRPALGIAETEWLYTNRPLSGGVFAPRVAGPDEATVADRYLIRVEPGRDDGSAEVFVAHRRVARKAEGWRLIGNDPYLEAELLRGMLVFLGYEQERSHEAVAAASAGEIQAEVQRFGGEPQLVLDSDRFDAWRRVGLALDRAGFTVDDRDRSAGVYYVRYDTMAETGAEPPEEGWLASFAFWRDEPVPDTIRTYRLVLDQAEAGTRVRVLPGEEDGEAPDEELVTRMLGLLAEQLR